MTTTDRLRMQRHAPDALAGFAGVQEVLENAGLDAKLRHLVKLRASQMNRCAFCVRMHNDEARADGETQERLETVVVWRDVDCFTEAERAALAWTEALTTLHNPGGLEMLHGDLTRHFDDKAIAALTGMIAMINVWNRLQVASHGGHRLPVMA